MHPFAIRGVGKLWLGALRPLPMSQLLYLQAIDNRAATPRREVYAYYFLLKRTDGGRARGHAGFNRSDSLPLGGAGQAVLPGADRLG